MLLDTPLQCVVDRFVPAPLPQTGIFDGQTVLIIGATADIRLAAAVHFATLSVNIIITSCVASHGDAAKWHIEEAMRPSYKDNISCLKLDLKRYNLCTSFMAKLKSSLPGPATLNMTIVNGDIVNSHWEESAKE